MRKQKSPCYQCADRQLGCHSTCEKYLAFDKDNAKTREDIYKKREIEYRLNNRKEKRKK